MNIDTDFDFVVKDNCKDPDHPKSGSPTLRSYHQFLWSKPLPCGTPFTLEDRSKDDGYLYHKSHLGDFSFGSDAITHSYRGREWVKQNIKKEEADELFKAGCTIGAYIIFPNKKIGDEQTINQARGTNSLINDRFDLTLECIRRFYLGEKSPLYETLARYKNFFDLFGDFAGYVKFFLLDDLLDGQQKVKFYLPFDDFKSAPGFQGDADYLTYKKGVMAFIAARNKRIEDYTKQHAAK